MFMNEQKKGFSFPLESADESVDFSLFSGKRNEGYESVAEGQLAIDVAQTAEEVIVVAAMAGTLPEDIELHLHNDLLTIRGKRISPAENAAEYFHQGCYWGKFSRSVILPVDVKSELVQAQYRNGMLVIRLPKAKTNTAIPIMVIEE